MTQIKTIKKDSKGKPSLVTPLTSLGPPTAAPQSPLHSVSVPIPKAEVTPKELVFAPEQWDDLTRTAHPSDCSDDSEVEVISLSSARVQTQGLRAKVEGVVSPDPFEVAQIQNLHGAPVPTLDQKSGNNKQVFYVVFHGKQPGIYQTWSAASAQLRGVRGSSVKKFSSCEEARRAWSHAQSNGTGGRVDQHGNVIQAQSPFLTPPKPSLTTTPPSLSTLPSTPPPTPVFPGRYKGPRRSTSQLLAIVHKAVDDVQAAHAKDSKAKSKINTEAKPEPQHSSLPPPSTSKKRSTIADAYHSIPSRSDATAQTGYHPDHQIFVVIQGHRPGIYYGRKNAMELGIGPVNPLDAEVVIAGDRAQANALFAEAWADETIAFL